MADMFAAVKRGDRVAQLILERIVTPEVQEVEELDDTQRGAGGFGSTGQSSMAALCYPKGNVMRGDAKGASS